MIRRLALTTAALTAAAGLAQTSVFKAEGGELWAMGGCLVALGIIGLVVLVDKLKA